jgi:hypothetical protein
LCAALGDTGQARFFLKKKKQKDFYPWARALGADAPNPEYRSFFASFCSQKEDSE